MADFIPSTTQEGQGGAQILSSNIQYANAGGVVRGIERGVNAMQEEQKYQREIDRAKAIEKKKSIDKLNEQITSIQVPAFTTLAEDEFKGFWDKVYSGESKDWQSDFQKTYSNIMKYVNASNDFVAGRDNLANSNFYNEDDGVFINGMRRGFGLMNTKPPQDMLEARNEGGADAVVGLFYNNYSSSSPNIYDTEPSDFGKVLQDYLDAKMKIYGEEDSKLKDLDGKIGVNTTRGFNDETQEKIRQDLLLNKEMRLRFLKASGQPYKHMTEEKMQELWSDAVGQMRMPQTNKMSGFTNNPKDRSSGLSINFGGGGKAENDRYYFRFQQDLDEPRGDVSAGTQHPTNIIRVEAKGSNQLQDLWDSSTSTLRAAIVGVGLDGDGNPEYIITNTGDEVPYEENSQILEKEYGLTRDAIKNLYKGQPQQSGEQEERVVNGTSYTLEELKSFGEESGVSEEDVIKLWEESK